MITTSDINTILGIKENFQLHGALKDILFDEDKKTEVFEKFLEIENDLSYDWFTNYFQTNQSNRDSLMQDYTPDCICKIIQGLQKPNGIILDECSGIGGLTISTWNQNKSKTFYCEELSDNSVMLLLFNLSIRNIKAYVRHGNVLTNEFGVIQTNAINPKYLFYVLEMVMPDFLRKYQTGLNINPKIFKLLKFSVHTDPTTQWIIVKMLDYLKNVIFNEEKYLGAVEDVKQIHLDGMFI